MSMLADIAITFRGSLAEWIVTGIIVAVVVLVCLWPEGWPDDE